jgi:3-methyladenine DNA glycosylase/8-oxoguanine DNA glycosylase
MQPHVADTDHLGARASVPITGTPPRSRRAKLGGMPTARSRADWARSAHDLARHHELAARMLARHGPPQGIRPTPRDGRFASLARAITFQQLSTRAAGTIWERVCRTVGEVRPEVVLDTPVAELRAAGLSGAKTSAIHDLAEKTTDGTLQLHTLGRRDDAQVVHHLSQVRGIGEWTAQMFLIFDLGRTDVWPTGDLGVRAGWASATGAAHAPSPRDLDAVGEPFSPHRSVVAWWCWREVDSGGEWP